MLVTGMQHLRGILVVSIDPPFDIATYKKGHLLEYPSGWPPFSFCLSSIHCILSVCA